jgi:hypothetical protein
MNFTQNGNAQNQLLIPMRSVFFFSDSSGQEMAKSTARRTQTTDLLAYVSECRECMPTLDSSTTRDTLTDQGFVFYLFDY